MIYVLPLHANPNRKKGGEGIDLNDLSFKQGLITNEEFQAILEGVRKKDDDADEMAEGLDLVSLEADETATEEVVEELVGEAAQSVGRAESEEHSEEKQTEASTQSGADVTPTEAPKNVKRKLVLKDESTTKGKQIRRTSKRRLEQEMKKKGPGDASEAVEILSEECEAPEESEHSAPPPT